VAGGISVKVYVLPADAHGCGHYRLIWPASALQAHGYDITVLPPHEKSGFLAKVAKNDDGSEQLTSVSVPPDADVIILQRPAHPLQPQMINMMRSNGIAVVVDMDDDMSSIDPNNIAYQTYHPKSQSPLSWKHAAESCRVATLVTTSTRALQRVYVKHGRGMVLDNYVPEAYLSMEKGDVRNFGWAGTTKSHPNDLQVAGNTYQRLIDEGFPFRTVGGASSVKQAARLRDEVDSTGSIPLIDWARTIYQELYVGMAPLGATAFNQGKSRLKAIEYMAGGVPWVGSPREEYRRLNRESGCGLMASTPKEWYTNLKRLLTDEILYKEQSEAGKDYMTTETYQLNAWRFAEAWTRAHEMERGR
jgi:glycosyltransferase involved in cell wall biosynthesis